MVGVRTRNKALDKSEEMFDDRFKKNGGSDMQMKKTNRNSNLVKAKRKTRFTNVKRQTKKITRKIGEQNRSSILTRENDTVSENQKCKNTEQEKLEEKLRLLTEELSNKNEQLYDNEKTIDEMIQKQKDMEKRDSEMNKKFEKMKEKMEVTEKKIGTPMNSVGTKGGVITKMSELTGQTLNGISKTEIARYRTGIEREQMKELVAAVTSIVNVYCRKEIFPNNKFLTDKMAEMALQIGYTRRKIAIGMVTMEQLLHVGPKLVHQGVARWRKNAQHQAMRNYKGKNKKMRVGEELNT